MIGALNPFAFGPSLRQPNTRQTRVGFGQEKFYEVLEQTRAKDSLEQKFGLKTFFQEILKHPAAPLEQTFTGTVAGITFQGKARYTPNLKKKQVAISFEKGPFQLQDAFFLTVKTEKGQLRPEAASADWEEYSGYKAALILLSKADVKLQGFQYSAAEGNLQSIRRCLA